jgi:hypothetical protein
VICYFLGGPTFPQSVRVASATVAPGGTYLSFPRRSISSEEPLSLIPFVPGKNSDENSSFVSGPSFPQSTRYGSTKRQEGTSVNTRFSAWTRFSSVPLFE